MFEWVEEGAPGSSNINNISLAQFNVFSGLVVIATPIDCIVHNSQAKNLYQWFQETYETKNYDVQYPGLILKLELRRKLM